MAKAFLIAAVLFALIPADAFAAGPAGTNPALRPTVSLRCEIVNSKVVKITNSTGSVISAGTRISYDAVRAHGAGHYGGSFLSPQLQPGAFVQRGGEDSSTCTAWFVRPLLMSP
ncbi:MAG TPA: hypothetical protein VFB16_13930 [Bauldia sp.]|nr:hypothetical protein [Bauldia sp.]